MTQRSGPNPRELHGKIPTTSVSFGAGSEVDPYCFQYTHTQSLLKYGMTMHLVSNQNFYRDLVVFFNPMSLL